MIINRSIRLLCGLIFISWLTPYNACAALDMFLVIDGIEGESTDRQFPKSIDITTFSDEILNLVTSSTTGGSLSKAHFSDVYFEKTLDKTSTALRLKVARGETIKNATFYLRKQSAQDSYTFWEMKFMNLLISSISESSSESDGIPKELLSINFSQVVWEYSESTDTGGSGGGGGSQQVCGNGVKEGSEQCDDGNRISNDGCSAFCILECVPSPEVCDYKDNNCDGKVDNLCAFSIIDTEPDQDVDGVDLHDFSSNVITASQLSDLNGDGLTNAEDIRFFALEFGTVKAQTP